MKKIGIIGSGFAGTMTAVQLIQRAETACEILMVEEGNHFNKGVAYSPYSKKHLLNVITAKMSAFPDLPNHFLDWLMQRSEFSSIDKSLIANAFMPRHWYGLYLVDVWQEALKLAAHKGINITMLSSRVVDIDRSYEQINLQLENGRLEQVDYCVIATGNNLPMHPQISNRAFYHSKNYFQNPWEIDAVSQVKQINNILILGNGLTMVDTVLGLLEQGFLGTIYALSPNGFNILPHRHNGLSYSKFVEELPNAHSLLDIVRLANKHIKMVRACGISAEPIIDSIRPYTQEIWKKLSTQEKRTFVARLRHLWGVARHRIPLQIHDKLQQLRIEGRLKIMSGKLVNILETDSGISVHYQHKKEAIDHEIVVDRVINCTGPDSNLMNLESSFLKKALLKGLLTQDALKLGIVTDTNTFEIFNAKEERQPNLLTLGGNLRGELWESTAVHELREQAARLATGLCVKIKKDSLNKIS